MPELELGFIVPFGDHADRNSDHRQTSSKRWNADSMPTYAEQNH